MNQTHSCHGVLFGSGCLVFQKFGFQHLMFDCVVAQCIWSFISEHFGIQVGTNYESIARFQISHNKNSALNTVCSVALWCLWKYRHSRIFKTTQWLSIKQVWRNFLKTVKFWSILSPEQSKLRMGILHLSDSFPSAASLDQLWPAEKITKNPDMACSPMPGDIWDKLKVIDAEHNQFDSPIKKRDSGNKMIFSSPVSTLQVCWSPQPAAAPPMKSRRATQEPQA